MRITLASNQVLVMYEKWAPTLGSPSSIPMSISQWFAQKPKPEPLPYITTSQTNPHKNSKSFQYFGFVQTNSSKSNRSKLFFKHICLEADILMHIFFWVPGTSKFLKLNHKRKKVKRLRWSYRNSQINIVTLNLNNDLCPAKYDIINKMHNLYIANKHSNNSNKKRLSTYF